MRSLPRSGAFPCAPDMPTEVQSSLGDPPSLHTDGKTVTGLKFQAKIDVMMSIFGPFGARERGAEVTS